MEQQTDRIISYLIMLINNGTASIVHSDPMKYNKKYDSFKYIAIHSSTTLFCCLKTYERHWSIYNKQIQKREGIYVKKYMFQGQTNTYVTLMRKLAKTMIWDAYIESTIVLTKMV